jgi:hypothetical protein
MPQQEFGLQVQQCTQADQSACRSCWVELQSRALTGVPLWPRAADLGGAAKLAAIWFAAVAPADVATRLFPRLAVGLDLLIPHLELRLGIFQRASHPLIGRRRRLGLEEPKPFRLALDDLRVDAADHDVAVEDCSSCPRSRRSDSSQRSGTAPWSCGGRASAVRTVAGSEKVPGVSCPAFHREAWAWSSNAPT